MSVLRAAAAAEVLLIIMVSVLLGCPRGPGADSRATRQFRVYRGSFEEPGSEVRRFRVLLYADLPDRVHAEVLPPLGGPALILDGGGGRVAVAVARERTAWVGSADERALERVVGVPIDLKRLVRAVLLGEEPGMGVELVRVPSVGEGMPKSIELTFRDRRLRLWDRGRRRRAAAGHALGSGEPPPGFEVRPIGELEVADGPLLGGGSEP